MPKPDFPPADVAEYLSDYNRFASHGPRTEWQTFLLWRIAESLSELAGAEWARAAQEDRDGDGDAPWRERDGEDDE